MNKINPPIILPIKSNIGLKTFNQTEFMSKPIRANITSITTINIIMCINPELFL